MKLLRSGVVSPKDLGGGVGWRSVTNCIRGCGIANAADLNPELCNFHEYGNLIFMCLQCHFRGPRKASDDPRTRSSFLNITQIDTHTHTKRQSNFLYLLEPGFASFLCLTFLDIREAFKDGALHPHTGQVEKTSQAEKEQIRLCCAEERGDLEGKRDLEQGVKK